MLRDTIGKAGELMVAAQCARRGYIPALPYEEDIPFDLVAIKADRALKIQVKSCASLNKRRDRYEIKSSTGSRNAYSPDDVDFLIVWLEPENCYYIIPVYDILGVSRINLTPHRASRGRFEQYKNKWELLDET